MKDPCCSRNYMTIVFLDQSHPESDVYSPCDKPPYQTGILRHSEDPRGLMLISQASAGTVTHIWIHPAKLRNHGFVSASHTFRHGSCSRWCSVLRAMGGVASPLCSGSFSLHGQSFPSAHNGCLCRPLQRFRVITLHLQQPNKRSISVTS